MELFIAVYATSIFAAPKPRASETVAIDLLSERMVVAIDQYAALSSAVATRKPVEMRFCVSSMFLLTLLRDSSAVSAAKFVLMLFMCMPQDVKRKWDNPDQPVQRRGIMPLGVDPISSWTHVVPANG